MPESVQDLIRAEAKKQGIPSSLALAVAEQESGFNPTLFGPEIEVGGRKTKAIGTFQLLDDTAKRLGVDPNDPRQNITGGVKYLRELMDQHQGDIDKVLATYGGVVHDTDYVPGVRARLERFKTTESANATADASAAARAGTVTPAPAPAVPGATPPLATPPPAGTSMAFPPGQQPNVVAGGAKIEPLEGGGLLQDIGMGIVRAHDPRTQAGRQNLFGLAGELAATAFAPEMEGPIWAQRAMRIGAPLVGAAAAAGGEQAVENAIGTGDQTSAVQAGALQGMYNVAGTAMMWPVRRLGKLFIGSTVARNAKTMLEENLARAGDRMKGDIAALRLKRDEAVEAGRLLTQNALESIRTQGAELLSKLPTARAAGAAVRSGVGAQTRTQIAKLAGMAADTELANDAALSDVRAIYNDVARQYAEPGMVRTAQLAREVFTGPTKIALDQAGEKVAATAAAGPPISIAGVQAKLNAMTEVAKPAALFSQGEEAAAGGAGSVGLLATIAANTPGKSASGVMAQPAQKMSAAEFKQFVTQQAALTSEERAPLPQILNLVRNLNADEPMEFSTGHALKRLLDERVRWDRSAKAINEQLTKGTRQALREELAVDDDYNAANATYESLVGMYRKGIGAKLQRAFQNDPDAAAGMLDPKKPIAARMLRTLLVDQAAAGGDARLGQQAWDATRATYVHQKLMGGGIEGLEKTLTKLTTQHGEFMNTVFGDDTGQSVLHNLQAIVHGYNNVLRENAARTAQLRLASRLERSALADQGTEAATAASDAAATAREATKTATASKLERARAEGRARVSDASRKGNEAIEAAKVAGRASVNAAGDALESFKGSSLSSPPPSIAGTIGDIGHVMYTQGQTRGGFLALLRLLNGPSSADLLTWMALSPRHTRLFVQATTSPFNERAGSELLRSLVGMLTPPQAQGAGPAAAPPSAPAGRGPGPVGAAP